MGTKKTHRAAGILSEKKIEKKVRNLNLCMRKTVLIYIKKRNVYHNNFGSVTMNNTVEKAALILLLCVYMQFEIEWAGRT